jgi:hypothetical protein
MKIGGIEGYTSTEFAQKFKTLKEYSIAKGEVTSLGKQITSDVIDENNNGIADGFDFSLEPTNVKFTSSEWILGNDKLIETGKNLAEKNKIDIVFLAFPENIKLYKELNISGKYTEEILESLKGNSHTFSQIVNAAPYFSPGSTFKSPEGKSSDLKQLLDTVASTSDRAGVAFDFSQGAAKLLLFAAK